MGARLTRGVTFVSGVCQSADLVRGSPRVQLPFVSECLCKLIEAVCARIEQGESEPWTANAMQP